MVPFCILSQRALFWYAFHGSLEVSMSQAFKWTKLFDWLSPLYSPHSIQKTILYSCYKRQGEKLHSFWKYSTSNPCLTKHFCIFFFFFFSFFFQKFSVKGCPQLCTGWCDKVKTQWFFSIATIFLEAHFFKIELWPMSHVHLQIFKWMENKRWKSDLQPWLSLKYSVSKSSWNNHIKSQ